jgi:hypothetical protein
MVKLNVCLYDPSQEGYFSWLLKSADADYAIVSRVAQERGFAFVKFLIGRYRPDIASSLSIERIEVVRQWDRTDLPVLMNGVLHILTIEEKVGGAAVGDQLKGYLEDAVAACDGDANKLFCIFFKTDDADADKLFCIFSKTEHQRSTPEEIEPRDLLNFFAPFNVGYDIFNEFRNHLLNIERQTSAYATIPIKYWNKYNWYGLFCLLESARVELDPVLDYNDFSFWCLSWNRRKWGEYPVHLQINGWVTSWDLCFMISGAGYSSSDRTLLGNSWSDHVLRLAASKDLPVHHRLVPFGNGELMCVAVVHRADWLGSDDSVIDKDRVLSTMRSYDDFFLECVNNN